MRRSHFTKYTPVVRFAGLIGLCVAFTSMFIGSQARAQEKSKTSTSVFTELYLLNSLPAGVNPAAGLVRDSEGNLYGTTTAGGNTSSSTCTQQFNGCGAIFKLTRTGQYSVLHEFSFSDGSNPLSTLVRDSKGSLYGTTSHGGTSTNCYLGCGVVFKLSPDGIETVLHDFTGGADGGSPAGLFMDGAGISIPPHLSVGLRATEQFSRWTLLVITHCSIASPAGPTAADPKAE